MNEDELAELAAKVAKSLKWASFLLGAMLVILLIDLQLKRAVARQAVTASKLFTSAVLRFPVEGGDGERQTVATPGRAGSGAGSDGVDGDAPVAAGTDQADGETAGVPAAAPASPRKRTAGNGKRTSRPEAGG